MAGAAAGPRYRVGGAASAGTLLPTTTADRTAPLPTYPPATFETLYSPIERRLTEAAAPPN